MKIRSIEPTPNPNSMKLNLDERLPEGQTRSYVRELGQNAPESLRQLLEIPGVKSIYQVADFISIERNPKYDWQPILTAAAHVFEGNAEGAESVQLPQTLDGASAEIKVFVQQYRGIPMQIKLLTPTQDLRVALPDRYGFTAKQAAQASGQFLQERKWVEQGVRYGDVQAVGEEMVQLIEAAYDDERLQHLMNQAIAQGEGEAVPSQPLTSPEAAERYQDPDWKKRFAALDQLHPTEEDLPLLGKAIHDENASIRRLAAVYLGAIGGSEVLPHLFAALQDPAVAVRRAAGDSLSDLGDPAAILPMAEALQDPSKLVRWRAARFLYEVGDASALPALRAVVDDPEFEVALQAKMAVERIEGGKAASGPLWQQLARDLSSES
jgi:Virulence factor/Scaffold protein Nfu/NifU N terminal/HEAT repeats